MGRRLSDISSNKIPDLAADISQHKFDINYISNNKIPDLAADISQNTYDINSLQGDFSLNGPLLTTFKNYYLLCPWHGGHRRLESSRP